MPPRLKLPLALSLVAIVALLFYLLSGVREGLLTLLIGVPSLLLGVLATRGRSGADEGEATTHPDTRPSETRHERGNGSAPAGALLEATMNGMREGVLVVNEHLRVVSANNAARSIFIRGGEAFAGQPLSARTRNPAIYAAYRAAVERRADTQVKVELVDPDRRVLELRVAPLEVGDTCDAIGVFFDITKLERLERVRQEFLTNVSHELRTPLTSILAFVESSKTGRSTSPRPRAALSPSSAATPTACARSSRTSWSCRPSNRARRGWRCGRFDSPTSCRRRSLRWQQRPTPVASF